MSDSVFVDTCETLRTISSIELDTSSTLSCRRTAVSFSCVPDAPSSRIELLDSSTDSFKSMVADSSRITAPVGDVTMLTRNLQIDPHRMPLRLLVAERDGGALRIGQNSAIAWLEEPILFDNADAMAEFARSVNVPVATGEQLYTRWEFRALLEQNAVGIIQPDICHAGGFSELHKLASMAETYYVTVSPHNSNGPISTIASLHLDMAINNCHMQELFLNSLDYYQEVLTNPLIVEDGYGAPPDGPGWGADLDDAVLAKYPPAEFTPIESEPYLKF